VTTLHGDKTQIQRNNILGDFRTGILNVVIATDVAARGLDVNDIQTVINYDFPTDVETYVHRIGRTARAGKKGESFSFFTEEDYSNAKDLVAVLKKANQNIPKELEEIARIPRKDLPPRTSNQQTRNYSSNYSSNASSFSSLFKKPSFDFDFDFKKKKWFY